MAHVGNRNRRIAGAVFTVATRQLFSEMHGIAVRTTVAAGEHFAARFEAVSQQYGRTLDSVNIRVVLEEVSQRFCGFVQLASNQILVHEDFLKHE